MSLRTYLHTEKRRTMPVLLCAIALLALVAGCRTPAQTSTQTSSPSGTFVPQSRSLVDGNISVAALTNYDTPFNVTTDVTNVKVAGTFNAFGGVPNQIEVYILNDSVYSSWLKGQAVDLIYDWGKKTTGNFDVAIPGPGNYHLLFSNYADSQVAPAQQVSATVALQWDGPAPK
jgi:hypothetical protein